MKFHSTALSGAFEVELELREDARGSFARAWCAKEFEAQGLVSQMVQGNVAATVARGTIRGMHYQVEPAREAKLVRCVKGAIFDAIIDLRPESPSYGQWLGMELTAGSNRMVYVPPGCGHGYQTLEDNTELYYLVSGFYSPEHERGVRWDDPAFGIQWPLEPGMNISDKDRSWPDYVLAPAGGGTDT